jgi:hypothetical protein
MRVVPNFGRQFVPPNEIFKFLLVLRSPQNKPIASGVPDSITEDDIQPKRYFVDEIVHVTVEASVIVTCEEQAPFLIEKYPASEMNRAYPR